MTYCQCGQKHAVPGECRVPSNVVKHLKYKDWTFEVAIDESWLRVVLHDGDTEWKGRKWMLSTHMLKSEIVQTAFLAVMTAEEHETREKFTYDGLAIFGPHYNVDRLADLVKQGGQEVR
jgi:hypothetical protein